MSEREQRGQRGGAGEESGEEDAGDIRREIGRRGESWAAQYLEGEGWTIVERNYRCKIGEVDIVASRAMEWGAREVPLLAFVEVKTRLRADWLAPRASVTASKRRKLVSLAKYYLMERRLGGEVMVRFDVLGVELSVDPPRIEHIPSAFDARGVPG
jgi:putative endonuclease